MPLPSDTLKTALAGRYRIEREVGAGGMATVYLAHDDRHDRKVALKVLRPELSAIVGAERFLAEIKTTASLQHPHILPLHDSGEVGGVVFYVMPYVEGESLRDRLNREKQLPVDEAVRIAGEVADALDYAHRHRVIHRDIKPENILLHDGRAQVADFGIALAVSRSDSGTRMTETGMSLGTPHYMSPEQAMGEREITARSDVYALGCVLYEMLVGEPPFTGPTAQAIVARVVTEEPRKLSGQRKSILPHVEAAVQTALSKLPADRFATAAAFGTALRTPTFTQATESGPHSRSTAAGTWQRVSAALGVLLLVVAGVVVWSLSRTTASGAPTVFDAALDTAVMAHASAHRNLSLSPRAEFVTYTVLRGESTSVWYRSLVDGSTYPIAGTAGGTQPRVSPDGRRLAFVRSAQVMIVPLEGGRPRTLAEVSNITTLEWVSATSLMVIDGDGKLLRWLDPDGGQDSEAPIPRCIEVRWLVDVQRLLCGGGGYKFAYLIDPASGRQSIIRSRADNAADTSGSTLLGSSFRIIDGRYLVYMSLEGDLRAASYDPSRLVAGRSVVLVPGVRRESYSGAGQYDLAPSGALVYAAGPNAEIGRLVRLRGDLAPEPLPVEPGAFLRFDLTRDGRRLAAAVQGIGREELRVYDVRSGRVEVLWHGLGVGQPLWNPSGERLIVNVTDSAGTTLLFGSPASWQSADTLVQASGESRGLSAVDFHADRFAIARNIDSLLVFGFDPTAKPVRLDTLKAGGSFTAQLRAQIGALSPDRRYLAYNTPGGAQMIVTPYPSTSRRAQVATNAWEPVWLSATELMFRAGNSFYRARIDPATGDLVGQPTLWLQEPRFTDTPGWSTRPSWDGGIIYVQGPEKTSAPYLRVIPNWVAQMKRAVDQANRQ